MKSMEIASLVASFVSMFLGIFAIWLSVVFYRLSNEVSEQTKEAAKGINSGVNRLEILFDRLYSDTFSMVKDTVSDMRRHMWPDKTTQEEIIKIEKTADEKIGELKREIENDLSSLVTQVGNADYKIEQMQTNISSLIDKAIRQTRRVELEAQEEISMTTVLNSIISLLRRYENIKVMQLYMHPTIRKRFPKDMVIAGLEILLRDGFISTTGPIDDNHTDISITKKAS